jgi:Virulence activator alpha C-term
LFSLLEHQLKAHEERLQSYQQVSLQLPAPDNLDADRAQILHRLTLEGGLTTEKATIEWLKRCIMVVKTLKE